MPIELWPMGMDCHVSDLALLPNVLKLEVNIGLRFRAYPPEFRVYYESLRNLLKKGLGAY